MNPLTAFFFRYAIIVCMICGTVSCGPSKHSHSPAPLQADLTPEATRLLTHLTQQNKLLMSFKGLGKLRIHREDKAISLRMAVTGVYPDRLRLSVMDISGRVLETVAYDGRLVYMISHDGAHPLIKKKSRRRLFEKLVSIPILPEEILGFLIGRPYIKPFDKVDVIPSTDMEQTAVFYHDGTRVCTMTFSPDKELLAMDIYMDDDTPAYQVSFLHYTTHEGFRVPDEILIVNPEKDFLRMKMDRYWPNALVRPDIFVLTDVE